MAVGIIFIPSIPKFVVPSLLDLTTIPKLVNRPQKSGKMDSKNVQACFTLSIYITSMVYKICITSNSGTPENLPSKFRRFSQNAETLLVRVYFGPEFRGPEFGVSLY